MSPTEAVVYIPEDIECDEGLYARLGVAHIERRGNRLLGVIRDWAHVLRLAGGGVVVVFAKREHCPPATNVRREYVGEETTRLIPFVANGEVPGRRTGNDGGGVMVGEVAAYRSGYADGFVDSATLRSAQCRQAWRG